MWKGSVPACFVELQTTSWRWNRQYQQDWFQQGVLQKCNIHPTGGLETRNVSHEQMAAASTWAGFLSWQCWCCLWMKNDWRSHRLCLVPVSLSGPPGESLAGRIPDKVYREEQLGRARHPTETSVLGPWESQRENLAAAADLETPHRSNVLSSLMLVKAFHFPKCFWKPRAESRPSHSEL